MRTDEYDVDKQMGQQWWKKNQQIQQQMQRPEHSKPDSCTNSPTKILSEKDGMLLTLKTLIQHRWTRRMDPRHPVLAALARTCTIRLLDDGNLLRDKIELPGLTWTKRPHDPAKVKNQLLTAPHRRSNNYTALDHCKDFSPKFSSCINSRILSTFTISRRRPPPDAPAHEDSDPHKKFSSPACALHFAKKFPRQPRLDCVPERRPSFAPQEPPQKKLAARLSSRRHAIVSHARQASMSLARRMIHAFLRVSHDLPSCPDLVLQAL